MKLLRFISLNIGIVLSNVKCELVTQFGILLGVLENCCIRVQNLIRLGNLKFEIAWIVNS